MRFLQTPLHDVSPTQLPTFSCTSLSAVLLGHMASTQSGQNTDSLSPATRSCHRCNQKKIRCSKSQPCSSCVKSNSDCVFPGPGRAPRRKKRPLKAELVSRLKSLEQQVRGLTTEPGNSTLHDSLDGSESFAEATASEDGRLVPDEGSTRYVTHDALVGLMDQVSSPTFRAENILITLGEDRKPQKHSRLS